MRIPLAISLVGAILASSPPTNLQTVREGQVLSVSFPATPLAKGERITGFSLTVVQGHVQSISGIPPDWSISLDVDPMWQAKLSGGCHHGASALTSASQLPSVTVNVLQLEVGPPFSLAAEIETTTDFEKAVSKPIAPGQLIVRTIDGA